MDGTKKADWAKEPFIMPCDLLALQQTGASEQRCLSRMLGCLFRCTPVSLGLLPSPVLGVWRVLRPHERALAALYFDDHRACSAKVGKELVAPNAKAVKVELSAAKREHGNASTFYNYY